MIFRFFEVMHAENLDSLFMLPFSSEAFDEYELLQEQLHNREYDENAMDQWRQIWGVQF